MIDSTHRAAGRVRRLRRERGLDHVRGDRVQPGRAAAVAANLATIRWASLRTKIINTAGRIATTGRRLDLHLPDGWASEPGWQRLWAIATGPPPLRPT